MTRDGYEGVVIYGGRARRQIGLLPAMIVAVLSVTGLGAATKLVFDALGWREINAPLLARTAADDPTESEARQISALVVMLRDATESVEAMKRARARGGKVAEHADGALLRLKQAIEK